MNEEGAVTPGGRVDQEGKVRQRSGVFLGKRGRAVPFWEWDIPPPGCFLQRVRTRMKARNLTSEQMQKSEAKSAQRIENKGRASKRVHERVRRSLKIKGMRKNECAKECTRC